MVTDYIVINHCWDSEWLLETNRIFLIISILISQCCVMFVFVLFNFVVSFGLFFFLVMVGRIKIEGEEK